MTRIERHYTTSQAAELLGITPRHVTLEIRNGNIYAIKSKGGAGKKWLIPEGSINAYLNVRPATQSEVDEAIRRYYLAKQKRKGAA